MRAAHILVFAAPALLAPLAIAACTTTSSSDLKTTDIRASMLVNISDNDPSKLTGVPEGGADGGDGGAPDSGSFIAADLYKDDSLTDLVDLSDGDDLTINTNLVASTRVPRALHGFYDTHEADFAKLTDVTFILTRKSGTSAPSSHVAVPGTVMMTAPKQDDMISFASGKVTFTWSNVAAGSKVFVFVHPCGSFSASASSDDVALPDNGSFDVPISKIPGAPPAAPTCYLARITRRMTGTADPAWHAGSSVGADRDFWLSFTGTP